MTWIVEFASHLLIVSLWSWYCYYQVWREKNVVKPAPGKRRCNCRNEVYHRQIGPGMFQQMTEQVKKIHTEDVDRKNVSVYLVHILGCIFNTANTLTSSVSVSWHFIVWLWKCLLYNHTHNFFFLMCWRGLWCEGLFLMVFLTFMKLYTSLSVIYLSRSVTNVLMWNM